MQDIVIRAALQQPTPPPALRPGETETLVTVWPGKGGPFSYVAVKAWK